MVLAALTYVGSFRQTPLTSFGASGKSILTKRRRVVHWPETASGPALVSRSRLAIEDWDTMGGEDRMKGKWVRAGSLRRQAALLLSVALAGGALVAQTAGKQIGRA